MPTERRLYRVRKVIHQRQLDIIIALDGVHDQHNLSAVLRTADATGIGKVVWFPDYRKTEPINPEVSKGSERWVDLKTVAELTPELKRLKQEGYNVAATHMGRKAVDFRAIDWTRPWVIVFGNEHRGCSEETVELADANIFLPMAGFVQSLNISVAAAVTMYEVQRQRQNAGMFDRPAPGEQIRLLYNQWGLSEDRFTVEELMETAQGELPQIKGVHMDGRYLKGLPTEKKGNVQKK